MVADGVLSQAVSVTLVMAIRSQKGREHRLYSGSTPAVAGCADGTSLSDRSERTERYGILVDREFCPSYLDWGCSWFIDF